MKTISKLPLLVLTSMKRPKYITRLLMALGFTQLIAISGCADSTHSKYRDQQSEELIRSFYASSREQLEITSVTGGSKIDAYCVLVPYQDSLNDKDNLAVPANAFLKQIGLQMQEDYWHIVVRSAGRFTLIRINVRSIPLAPEYSHLKSSCTVGKILVISSVRLKIEQI